MSYDHYHYYEYDNDMTMIMTDCVTTSCHDPPFHSASTFKFNLIPVRRGGNRIYYDSAATILQHIQRGIFHRHNVFVMVLPLVQAENTQSQLIQ